MRDYQTAETYLGKKTDRPLPGRFTRLQRRDDGSIAVRYHATDVITYRPDGTIRADSGGYRTMTTKARIAEYSPIRVSQTRGLWYVGDGLYQDGIIYQDGTIRGTIPAGDTERAKRALDKQVRRYIRGFCDHVIAAGEISAPSGGDCWGCHMRASDPAAEPMGYGHYLDHFGGTPDEPDPYYVPSLVTNAIRARGYGSPAMIWAMIQGETKRGHARILGDVLRAYFRKIKPGLLAARD